MPIKHSVTAGSGSSCRRGATGAALLITAVVTTLGLGAHGAAAAPVDPSGTWLIADGRARIEIAKCGPNDREVCGFVVWLKTPLNDEGTSRVDVKNPDPKKKGRPILGHQMLLGLKPNDDDHYEGKVYNADEGKSVDVSVWREEGDELKVHGCMLAILCGSQTWSLVTDAAPGQLTGPVNGPNGPRADPEWAPKAEHDKAKPKS